MKKLFFAVFLAAFFMPGYASWTGDTSSFCISDSKIDLCGVAQSSTVYICKPSAVAVNAEFSCSVKMDYTPSSVNNIKLYLLSNNEDLTAPLNGYYLRIGYPDKTIHLYKQSGTSTEKLASAEQNLLSSASPQFSIRLLREENSLWQLFFRNDEVPLSSENGYELCFSVEDESFVQSSFMGIVIRYSTTRYNAFHISGLRASGENGTPMPELSSPEQGSVVINEILFNPVPGGSDYVEFYNTTAEDLELTGCTLANKSTAVKIESAVIKANSFLVLTPDKDFVCATYAAPEENVVQNKLPSMPDDEGFLQLLSQDGIHIDSLSYNKDMHSALLEDEEGVALERIMYDGNLWQSASSFCNYGTPGTQNSQYSEAVPDEECEVWLSSEYFTPDSDGFLDYVTICHNAAVDAVGDLYIYDANGAYIKEIYSQKLLSAGDCAIWDGTDNRGRLCPAGIYVVLFQAYNENGYAIKKKIPVVLTAVR